MATSTETSKPVGPSAGLHGSASVFSSTPVAPVIASSHARRQREMATPTWPRSASAEGDENARAKDTRAGNEKETSETGGPRSMDTEREESPKPSGNASARPSSMSLPALSRAAMLHIRDRGVRGQEDEGVGATPPTDRDQRRSRSRSRERERRESDNGGGTNNRRWTGGSGEENGNDDRGDDAGSNFSDEGRPPGDDSPSPRHNGNELRIMFHGREVYADDLIGLRVAKTFVGHGRFLGQVVKFDEPTSLYTIVYADGDAEELGIEATIQILIQDEIERADPTVPPISATYRNENMSSRAESPEEGNITPTSSTATSSAPVVPVGPHHGQSSQHMPAYQTRRSTLSISEREAQFVISLFENHAMPILLRQGWRVQSNTAGTEQRFFAPSGTFRGAGHVFSSALDVVELIASDNEMLSICFPQNVHSAILSLFPDPATSRKRNQGASSETDGYDPKRPRSAREEAYGHAGASTMVRAGGQGGVAAGGPPLRGASEEHLLPPSLGYRPDDRERGSEAYGASRIPPIAADRAPHSHSRPDPRAGPQDFGDYRRPEYRAPPMHGSSDNNASRWAGPVAGGRSSEQEYRRPYSESSDWPDRDPVGSRGGPPGPGGYTGQGYYDDRRGPAFRAPPGPSNGGNEGSHPSYRYRGDVKPPTSGEYSPGPDSFAHRFPGREPGPEFRGNMGQPSANTQDRFARPLNRGGNGTPLLPPGGSNPGRGFSMMDVDRNSGRSSGGPALPGVSYDNRMERGRPQHPSSGNYPPLPSQGSHFASRHQRTASSSSHYSMESADGPSGSNTNPGDDPRDR
ncbi:hypothetical protein Poli38472_000768 [Pythium oligandrum]|uniref:PTM/DIR17-like Tudor domain-containing protein n=1 Tax=Pythium oligandrum TaxID=41045 RepID=A0A8K1CCB4_PYTOL|nr:hypothetical protein Poli38472_000768 [Pythium oligandrum]|eukprot:TMW60726.1 hypothetical protein Poli38472_000768 [Pythium oligandrum]